MEAEEWETAYREAVQCLVRWRVRDADATADALGWYWYMLSVERARPGPKAVWWALRRARSGRAWPGTAKGHGWVDAGQDASPITQESLPQRRYLDPAKQAMLADEVAWVSRRAKNTGEKTAMAAHMLSQTDAEAAMASGLSTNYVCASFARLRRRCRRERRLPV